ncbi:hypothetical protein KAR91_58865 [Candidatus Pacearchaeota archaeon]|nr:hypothetical protein [Candidatus Pacearchaeota archaeon]
MTKKDKIELIDFINCDKYDHDYGGCLDCWKPYCQGNCHGCMDYLAYKFCKAERGNRCEHFEDVVLPKITDVGLKGHLYLQYAKQVDK